MPVPPALRGGGLRRRREWTGDAAPSGSAPGGAKVRRSSGARAPGALARARAAGRGQSGEAATGGRDPSAWTPRSRAVGHDRRPTERPLERRGPGARLGAAGHPGAGAPSRPAEGDQGHWRRFGPGRAGIETPADEDRRHPGGPVPGPFAGRAADWWPGGLAPGCEARAAAPSLKRPPPGGGTRAVFPCRGRGLLKKRAESGGVGALSWGDEGRLEGWVEGTRPGS